MNRWGDGGARRDAGAPYTSANRATSARNHSTRAEGCSICTSAPYCSSQRRTASMPEVLNETRAPPSGCSSHAKFSPSFRSRRWKAPVLWPRRLCPCSTAAIAPGATAVPGPPSNGVPAASAASTCSSTRPGAALRRRRHVVIRQAGLGPRRGHGSPLRRHHPVHRPVAAPGLTLA